MSATDELQQMLTGAGVEWKEHRHTVPGSMAIQRETLWGQPIDNTSRKPIPHVYHYRATEMGNDRLFLEVQLVTPAQAITATLGTGTCRNVSDPPEGFLCSECGWGDFNEPSHLLTGACYVGLSRGPRYCPNCGRRIEVDG